MYMCDITSINIVSEISIVYILKTQICMRNSNLSEDNKITVVEIYDIYRILITSIQLSANVWCLLGTMVS